MKEMEQLFEEKKNKLKNRDQNIVNNPEYKELCEKINIQ